MHPLLRSAIVVSLAMPWAPAMALNATVTESGELHSQPYFTAPRIAPVHRLSTVEVLERRRDWVRIEIGGNRSGWVPERSLDLSTQAPVRADAIPAALPGSAPQWIPRSTPRASNHALILPLGDAADAASATAIARLMGVPDANIQQPAPGKLDADGLRQALAGLDARLGADDRAFIYLSGQGSRNPCGEAILTANGENVLLAEFTRYLLNLARKADKLVVVIDAGRGDGHASGLSGRYTAGASACSGNLAQAPASPGNNVLIVHASRSGQNAFADDKGGLATQALRACLESQANPAGLANGDAWRRCAQAALDSRGSPQHITLGGNPALIPAPGLVGSGPTDPRQLLQAIHAQRSERRSVSIGGLRPGYRAGESIQLTVTGPKSSPPQFSSLYLLAAGDKGFTLLHPGPAAPAERFEGSQTLNLPIDPATREAIGSGRLRLLALVTDSPRNFQRSGFGGAGVRVATAPADARTLRDLPLEILGGDNSPTCQHSETRNLGAGRARQCSAAFGAALADITITP